MKIGLIEPLGVEESLIEELAAPLKEKGHEFLFFPQKTTVPAELAARSSGCEIVMIAFRTTGQFTTVVQTNRISILRNSL